MIAATKDRAKDAAELIDVRYDALPPGAGRSEMEDDPVLRFIEHADRSGFAVLDVRDYLWVDPDGGYLGALDSGLIAA